MLKMFRFSALLKCKQFDVYRSFMSKAFQCQDSWDKRLHSQIIKKVNLNNMFHEIDTKLNQTGKVSSIDVDIFANSINDNSHLEELEDIVHRFRLSSEAGNIVPSTHHAFVRSFFSFGNVEDLMRVLNDRLNYGIFPDDYCNVLMMDDFIKKDDFTNAAKVATLVMLQEDFNNPLVKYFCLYSCHKYLNEPGTWNKLVPEEEKSEVDDSEEVKIRVKYIRNPYFDDHFDLVDPNSLIGKTFKIIGEANNDPLSNSYHLLGLTLYKKWPQAVNFINNLLDKNDKINSGCINEIEKFLASVPPEEGEKGNEIQDEMEKLQNGIVKLKNNSIVDQKDLLIVTEEQLGKTVKEMEENLIKEQCELYEDWEKKREELLIAELNEMKKLQKIENIKLKKEELLKKEQELFFFDLEDKLDLQIENKRVRYPPKWHGKKKKKRTDTLDYVPPEVAKKYDS